MKRIIFSLILVMLCFLKLQAQTDKVVDPKMNVLLESISAMDSEEIRLSYLKTKSRRNTLSAATISRYLAENGHLSDLQPETKPSLRSLNLPDEIRIPAEFEEVEAIFINWPYITLDTNGNWAEQFFENIGPYYDNNEKFIGLGPVLNAVDTFSNSPYPPIFRKIINGIEPYAEVWINIWIAEDSLVIKDYMSSQGTPLRNSRFFVNQGNSFWYRDCGPVAFYYGNEDSIGFLDFEYYGGRPLDDELPVKLGEQADYPVFTSTLEFEGGNLLTDGMGTLFTTSAVYDFNADSFGQYYLSVPGDPKSLKMNIKSPLSQSAVRDSLIHLLNLSRLFVLPSLRFDGGTGHIDLYADMFDENSFVFTEFPPEMNKFIDYTRIENNVNTIAATNSLFETTYYYQRIPLPTKDDGSWYKSGYDYEEYTRTYSNHLIVNKAIIQPVFSDGIDGNVAGMIADQKRIEEAYPGYSIIPVDVRAFDGFGGAIHCITKQIPAQNPLLILHNPIRGSSVKTSFPVDATITNHSGIVSAQLFWRLKGSTVWNRVNLNPMGKDFFSATINGNHNAVADTVEYYISAISNNGKNINKPMTAPNGFYSFRYGSAFSSHDEVNPSFSISEFMPNPAAEKTFVRISGNRNDKLYVMITDLAGRYVHSDYIAYSLYELNTSNLKKGIYLVYFISQTGEIQLRRLMVR